MPTDYRCKGCGLKFSVGWYHCDFSTGFGAASLAVCTRCCAQHRIDQAMNLSAALTSVSFFDVTIENVPATSRIEVMAAVRARLRLTPHEAKRLIERLPILLGRDLPQYAAVELEAAFTSLGAIVGCAQVRSEVRDLIPQQQDRLLASDSIARADQELEAVWESVAIQGVRAGVTGVFSLDEQLCANCGAVGALTTEPERVPSACARCRSPIEEAGGWVT
jgi:ribosomal protein L7/L12